jgi:hypothetical protein
VAQKDIDGAKRILNTSTPAFRESFTTFRTGSNEQWKVETISEPIEVDSIVGMFGDKPVEGVVSAEGVVSPVLALRLTVNCIARLHRTERLKEESDALSHFRARRKCYEFHLVGFCALYR